MRPMLQWHGMLPAQPQRLKVRHSTTADGEEYLTTQAPCTEVATTHSSAVPGCTHDEYAFPHMTKPASHPMLQCIGSLLAQPQHFKVKPSTTIGDIEFLTSRALCTEVAVMHCSTMHT